MAAGTQIQHGPYNSPNDKDTALTGAGFERTKLLRGTATYGCRAPGRKRYRRDSPCAHSAYFLVVLARVAPRLKESTQMRTRRVPERLQQHIIARRRHSWLRVATACPFSLWIMASRSRPQRGQLARQRACWEARPHMMGRRALSSVGRGGRERLRQLSGIT